MGDISRVLSCAVAVAVGAAAAPAVAAVIVTAEEVGNDVVVYGGGSLDTSLWSLLSPGLQMPGLQADATIALGPAPEDFVDIYFMPVGFSGPALIGPGTTPFFADSGAGDSFGIGWVPLPIIAVPSGYVSGGLLTGTESTFLNQSFDSLGIAPGSYTWTWDTADGRGDLFTLNIVPAPGALAFAALAGLAVRRRRR